MRAASSLVLAFCLAWPALTTQAQATRRVAGLEIQYGFDFREDKDLSRRAFDVALSADPQTIAVQVFHAPTLVAIGGGEGSLHVVRSSYRTPRTETPEQLFAKATAFLSASDVKLISKSYEPVSMPGYEAGRYAFEAEHGAMRIGGELLVILERSKGQHWQLQFLFALPRFSWAVTPSLDKHRELARKALASARVVEP